MAKSRGRKLADIIVSAGVDIDGNLTFDGGSTSDDLTFADNDKANFGDSSDLQIFHDSSHSYIQDAGSGNLYLRTNGTAVVIDDGTNNLAAFNVSSGEAALYYGGSGKKLATTSTGVTVTGNIANSSGDLTLDVAGTIKLDADNTGTVYFQDAGTIYGIIERTSSSMRIRSGEQDGDIIFMGNDNGTNITALTLDISDAGTANFNNNITLSDNKQAQFGDGADGTIHHDGSHFRLRAGTGNFNVQANDFHLTDASNNAVSFLVDHDGATSLRYNQVQKLAKCHYNFLPFVFYENLILVCD